MHNPFHKSKGDLPERSIAYRAATPPPLDQEHIDRAFARLFSTDDGRVVLGHLQALTFQRALTSSAPEADLRYAEGQRALVAQMLRFIDRGKHR